MQRKGSDRFFPYQPGGQPGSGQSQMGQGMNPGIQNMNLQNMPNISGQNSMIGMPGMMGMQGMQGMTNNMGNIQMQNFQNIPQPFPMNPAINTSIHGNSQINQLNSSLNMLPGLQQPKQNFSYNFQNNQQIGIMGTSQNQMTSTSISQINSLGNLPQMNSIPNNLNNLSGLNSLGSMGNMNSMNNINNLNNVGQIGMGNLNPMNQINSMNQINPMNQMGQINQMNQISQINQINAANQMSKQMGRMNQMNLMISNPSQSQGQQTGGKRRTTKSTASKRSTSSSAQAQNQAPTFAPTSPISADILNLRQSISKLGDEKTELLLRIFDFSGKKEKQIDSFLNFVQKIQSATFNPNFPRNIAYLIEKMKIQPELIHSFQDPPAPIVFSRLPSVKPVLKFLPSNSLSFDFTVPKEKRSDTVILASIVCLNDTVLSPVPGFFLNVDGNQIPPLSFGEAQSYFVVNATSKKVSVQVSTKTMAPSQMYWCVVQLLETRPPEAVLQILLKKRKMHALSLKSVMAKTPQCLPGCGFPLENAIQVARGSANAFCPKCHAPICFKDLILYIQERDDEFVIPDFEESKELEKARVFLENEIWQQQYPDPISHPECHWIPSDQNENNVSTAVHPKCNTKARSEYSHLCALIQKSFG